MIAAIWALPQARAADLGIIQQPLGTVGGTAPPTAIATCQPQARSIAPRHPRREGNDGIRVTPIVLAPNHGRARAARARNRTGTVHIAGTRGRGTERGEAKGPEVVG